MRSYVEATLFSIVTRRIVTISNILYGVPKGHILAEDTITFNMIKDKLYKMTTSASLSNAVPIVNLLFVSIIEHKSFQ